ncbi:hypothetical protein ACWKWU_05335 [Chitinophaga lutea]
MSYTLTKSLAAGLVAVSLLSSCSDKPKKITAGDLEGNWLVVYPDHDSLDRRQLDIYGTIQDSIVSAKGLKLLKIDANNTFRQGDSLSAGAGQWQPTGGDAFTLRNGGEGFELFTFTPLYLKNDTLDVVEYIAAGKEKLPVNWRLKRITDKGADTLFTAPGNTWRSRPAAAENEAQLKQRLRSMLAYYSVYFRIVSIEASYFSPKKVHLPLTYYQHGVGMIDFDPGAAFARYFYDEVQALQAYNVLSGAFDALESEEYPSGDNFVIEYSMFLMQLAKAIK